MAAVIEPACDLRIGQVGVATLKLRRVDINEIRAEIDAKIRAAPQLLARAAVIVVEREALARSLFRAARLHRDVPEQFFAPVAELLAFSYELRRGRAG